MHLWWEMHERHDEALLKHTQFETDEDFMEQSGMININNAKQPKKKKNAKAKKQAAQKEQAQEQEAQETTKEEPESKVRLNGLSQLINID